MGDRGNSLSKWSAPDRGNGIPGLSIDAGLNDRTVREKFYELLASERTYGSPKKACEILGISFSTAKFHKSRDGDIRYYWNKAASAGRKLKYKKAQESLEKIAFEGGVEIVYKDEKDIAASNKASKKSLAWKTLDDLYELSKDPDNILFVKRVLGSTQFAALRELLNQQNLEKARQRDKKEENATDTLLRELYVAAVQRGHQIESPEQLRDVLIRVIDKMKSGGDSVEKLESNIDSTDTCDVEEISENENLLTSGDESLLD